LAVGEQLPFEYVVASLHRRLRRRTDMLLQGDVQQRGHRQVFDGFCRTQGLAVVRVYAATDAEQFGDFVGGQVSHDIFPEMAMGGVLQEVCQLAILLK
jgi:hypothetical protein